MSARKLAIKIIAAAVLIKGQGIFAGQLHVFAVMEAEEVLGESAITEENITWGFLDDKGAFYTREEISAMLGHEACAEDLTLVANT